MSYICLLLPEKRYPLSCTINQSPNAVCKMLLQSTLLLNACLLAIFALETTAQPFASQSTPQLIVTEA
jgi:hypothetical protein